MDPLQKKFNDWCDKGGDVVGFFRKNNIRYKHGEDATLKYLTNGYFRLQAYRDKHPRAKIKLIKKQLTNYHNRKNKPRDHLSDPLNEIGVFTENSPEYVEFLLNQLDKKDKHLAKAEEQLKELFLNKVRTRPKKYGG